MLAFCKVTTISLSLRALQVSQVLAPLGKGKDSAKVPTRREMIPFHTTQYRPCWVISLLTPSHAPQEPTVPERAAKQRTRGVQRQYQCSRFWAALSATVPRAASRPLLVF